VLTGPKPWNTRLIAVLILAGWGALYYFWLRDESAFFRWVVPIAALWPLWIFFRAAHTYFEIDADSIVWTGKGGCRDGQRWMASLRAPCLPTRASAQFHYQLVTSSDPTRV
jgi:hypothetical protein